MTISVKTSQNIGKWVSREI